MTCGGCPGYGRPSRWRPEPARRPTSAGPRPARERDRDRAGSAKARGGAPRATARPPNGAQPGGHGDPGPGQAAPSRTAQCGSGHAEVVGFGGGDPFRCRLDRRRAAERELYLTDWVHRSPWPMRSTHSPARDGVPPATPPQWLAASHLWLAPVLDARCSSGLGTTGGPTRAVRADPHGVRLGVSRIPPATTPAGAAAPLREPGAPRPHPQGAGENAAASPAPTAPTARHTTADSSTVAITGFCTFPRPQRRPAGQCPQAPAAQLESSAATRAPRRLKDMRGPLRDAIGSLSTTLAGRRRRGGDRQRVGHNPSTT